MGNNMLDGLISRSDVIDALQNEKVNPIDKTMEFYNDILEKCIRIVARIPLKQSRRKGKWYWSEGMYWCDQCESLLDEMTPYCPMCGADMRGEEDGCDK